jgi:hypothetical protein
MVKDVKGRVSLCRWFSSGTEAFRAIAGAGVNTRDTPPTVTAFTPVTEHAGGLFDNKERARARVAKLQGGRQ